MIDAERQDTVTEVPALLGGTPVRARMLPYGRQHVDESDIQAVTEVLRGDWLTNGPTVARFEEAFAAWVGARFAVALSSGTAALHAAAIVAGLGPDDEVILSPLTFLASANCLLYCGATPVFADIDPATLNLDPARVEAAVTSRTKAILPVHFAGLPCDMDRIQAIAQPRGLRIIEDAAHALGAEWNGRPAGEVDVSAFGRPHCDGGIGAAAPPSPWRRRPAAAPHRLGSPIGDDAGSSVLLSL